MKGAECSGFLICSRAINSKKNRQSAVASTGKQRHKCHPASPSGGNWYCTTEAKYHFLLGHKCVRTEIDAKYS